MSSADQEGARGRRGLAPIGSILDDWFMRRGLNRLRSHQEFEAAWQGAVGPEVGRQTRVVGYARGVLQIAVPNSALHQELRFAEARLLQLLAAHAGLGVVQRLKFIVGH